MTHVLSGRYLTYVNTLTRSNITVVSVFDGEVSAAKKSKAGTEREMRRQASHGAFILDDSAFSQKKRSMVSVFGVPR